MQPSSATRSYASITAKATVPLSSNLVIGGELRATPKLNPMVIFYPEAPEGKTSEETHKILHKVLNPKDDRFKVVRSRRVRGAGVLIQTESKSGLENIKKATE